MSCSRTIRVWTVLAGVAVAAACGGGDSGGPTALPTVPDPDREILVELYNETYGPNWIYDDNWLTDAPLGEWHGVTTDAGGRVTLLYLNENDLSGPSSATSRTLRPWTSATTI